MLTFSIVACKDEVEETDEPNIDDEFTGSIAGSPENNGAKPQEPPPIAVGDANAVIEIRTADDLKKIAQNGTYILMNDIDMTGVTFAPIGNYEYPFKGTLKSADGERFTISNVKVAVSEASVGPTKTYSYAYAGLFGATNGATVSNINVTNADISAVSTDEYCFVTSGIITGYAINTTVNNCSVSGKVYSKSKLFNSYAGGICGILEDGEITNCVSDAQIETADSKNRAVSGGIAALALLDSSVSHTVVRGSVKAVASNGVAYAAGLVGNTRKGSYTVCRSEADVYAETLEVNATEALQGAAYAGGIVGVSSAQNETDKTTFTRCYAIDKTVTAVGNDCAAYAGGIAAYIAYTDFTHCYTLCDVSLKATAKNSFASTGFGYISTTKGNSNADNYVADFYVKGCFSYGDLKVEHGKIDHMLLGTLYGYISDEASKTNIRLSFYNQNASYTLNGKENPSTLGKNGTAKVSLYFTEANISDFGWASSEWETVDGYLYAK